MGRKVGEMNGCTFGDSRAVILQSILSVFSSSSPSLNSAIAEGMVFEGWRGEG